MALGATLLVSGAATPGRGASMLAAPLYSRSAGGRVLSLMLSMLPGRAITGGWRAGGLVRNAVPRQVCFFLLGQIVCSGSHHSA